MFTSWFIQKRIYQFGSTKIIVNIGPGIARSTLNRKHVVSLGAKFFQVLSNMLQPRLHLSWFCVLVSSVQVVRNVAGCVVTSHADQSANQALTITVSFSNRLPQVYEEFYHTINNADHEKDLRWWSNNHGVNMAMNWPQFEVNYPLYFLKHGFECQNGSDLYISFTFSICSNFPTFINTDLVDTQIKFRFLCGL